MPIFDFECQKCKKTEEKIVKFSDKLTEIKCTSCKDGKMKKVDNFSNTSFNLKGEFH